MMKKFIYLVLAVLLLAACGGGSAVEEDTAEVLEPIILEETLPTPAEAPTETPTEVPAESPIPPSTGRIFMYGEVHGVEAILAHTLDIWGEFYHEYGMRHMFLEAPFFTGYWLNLWMQAEDDTILYMLFEGWRGSAKYNPYQLDFYRRIKYDFPETIFHGVDVGHGSDHAGRRLLDYLIENDLTDTAAYTLTRENIAQFSNFSRTRNHAMRSSVYMPYNFIREFDALGDQDIMMVAGAVHTYVGYFLGQEGVPTLVAVLYARYGDQLHLFDLTRYGVPDITPLATEMITVAGMAFEASYFGMIDLNFGDVVGQAFWRLEGAYDYFAQNPLGDDMLPFSNFPTRVEVGQVFVIDRHFADGGVERLFYRTSGFYWRGMAAAREFLPEFLPGE